MGKKEIEEKKMIKRVNKQIIEETKLINDIEHNLCPDKIAKYLLLKDFFLTNPDIDPDHPNFIKLYHTYLKKTKLFH